METKPTSPAIKGIMISLVLIVFSLVLEFMGQSQNKGLGSIGLLFFVVGIIWGCILYAKQLDGNVTFGNVFADGFKTSAAVTAIMVVFVIISLKLLFPETIDKAMEIAQKEMTAKNMPEDQMETGMNITRKFFTPIVVGATLFTYLAVGAIASLIGAGVAKKNPRDPFNQQG